ncbi:MAG: hypothetical protein J3K34DRAFT_517407 [Monoraphidium minutum]|nr:MAG: hypothetical protein J3K34DRAFT_517407 [Monoraphidium minutum]
MSSRGAERHRKSKQQYDRLVCQVKAQERKLVCLHEERRSLNARAAALSALVASLTALLRVTAPLRALAGGAGARALTAWHEELQALEHEFAAAAAAASPPPPHSPPPAPAPAGSSGGSAGRGGSESSGGGGSAAGSAAGEGSKGPGRPPGGRAAEAPDPSWARLLEGMLHDSGADAVAARFGAFSAADLAAALKAFCLEASMLLFHIRAGASGAAGARLRLGALLDEFLSTCAAVLVTAPHSLIELQTMQLDTCQPTAAGFSDEQGGFVLGQMELTPDQELAAAALLDLYEAHVSALLPRRAALVEWQGQCAADTDEQWALLGEITMLQSTYVWAVLGTAHALYATVLEPHQTAAGLVAGYPLVVPLLAYSRTLRDRRNEVRAAAAAAAAAVPAPLASDARARGASGAAPAPGARGAASASGGGDGGLGDLELDHEIGEDLGTFEGPEDREPELMLHAKRASA